MEKRASLEFIQNHPWTTRGGGKTSFDLSTTSCPPSGTSTHQSLRLVLPSDDPMFTGALESNGGASKPEDSEESDVTNAKLLNTPQAESSGVHGNLSRTASEPGRKPLSEGVPGTRRWMSTHPPAPAVTPKTPHGISFRSKGTTARVWTPSASSHLHCSARHIFQPLQVATLPVNRLLGGIPFTKAGLLVSTVVSFPPDLLSVIRLVLCPTFGPSTDKRPVPASPDPWTAPLQAAARNAGS